MLLVDWSGRCDTPVAEKLVEAVPAEREHLNGNHRVIFSTGRSMSKNTASIFFAIKII